MPLGFRNLIKASIRAESSSLLRTYLSTAEKNWLETEYKKYESSSAIESLFDETLGAGKRWVQDPQTGKRTQVVDNQPLTPTHFVEIVTYARNEIEKGNTQEITRLFKETTRLLRTVIVNPMNSRVHILLKGKGVLNPRSAGTFKSVTQRVVIEPDNKAKIYADINIKLPLDWAGTIEEWREGIRDEFAHSDAVLDVEEHRSPKSGRIAISAAQEWLTIPDLRAQNIRKLTTKQRLKILIGVLRNLREKHAGNELKGELFMEILNRIIWGQLRRKMVCKARSQIWVLPKKWE